MSDFEKEIHHVAKLTTAKIDHRPPKGGWAHGHYLRECFSCKAFFIGDKLAVTCADCAYATQDGRSVIFTDWETYASQHCIELSAEQKRIMSALVALLNDFETASFFKSRATGVTYLLKHFERFCKIAEMRIMSVTPETDRQIDKDANEMINIRYGRMIQHARGLERTIYNVKKELDRSGVKIGNKFDGEYPLALRVWNLAEQRDYFLRETDKARKAAAT